MLRLFVARQVVPALPRDERYRLGDQLLRAARSTTANIAEGYGRFHYLDNARGSCWEVLDHLIAGNDESLISAELLGRGREFVAHAVKLLNGIDELLEAGAQSCPGSGPITDNG